MPSGKRFSALKAVIGFLTGFFALIVIPLWQLLTRKTGPSTKGKKIVDAEFEEIKK